MLGTFSCVCCRLLTFPKWTLSKNLFRNTIRVSNGLDLDQKQQRSGGFFVWCWTSKSTVMVMSRRSVHLTILFPVQAWLSGKPVLCAHTFACHLQQPFLNQRKGGEWPYTLFHNQSPWKYGTGSGSNLLPLDLQSDTYLQSDLKPTALCGPV